MIHVLLLLSIDNIRVLVYKVGRPPGELGVSKSMECDISLQCFDTLVGRQEGHPACKKPNVGLLVVII